MSRYFRIWLGVCLIAVSVLHAQEADQPEDLPIPIEEQEVLEQADPAEPTVLLVPFEGEVELALLSVLERAFSQASDLQARAIIIEMNTPGGRVDSAVEIADLILEAETPIYMYVNPEATSAGAIISLAADGIYMNENAQIGTAAPVMMSGGETSENMDAKILSYVLAKVRSICERKGYDERTTEIALAMVDKDMEIDGITERGKLLTLTAIEALELGFIDSVVLDIDGVLDGIGLADATLVSFESTLFELIARFLSSSAVSSLLLTIGFLGLFIEVRTPGFGIPGAVGLAALVLFFFGASLAGLAGWESVILFILGFILLGVELFVIPGFGVAGVLGMVSIIASLVLAMLDAPIISPDFSIAVSWEEILQSVSLVLFSMTLAMVGALLLPLLFPVALSSRQFASWLVLTTEERGEEGYNSASETLATLVGLAGTARTPLRPAGIAEIDGQRIEVVSQGGFVPAHTPVTVVKVEGRRVVVKTS